MEVKFEVSLNLLKLLCLNFDGKVYDPGPGIDLSGYSFPLTFDASKIFQGIF